MMLRKKLSCILLIGALMLTSFASGCSDSSEQVSDNSSISETPTSAVSITRSTIKNRPDVGGSETTLTETYDEKGNIVHSNSTTTFQGSDEVRESTVDYTYVYDEQGNIKEQNSEHTDDSFSYSKTNTYNEHGDVINIMTYQGEVNRIDSYDYTYDENDRIVKCVEGSSISGVEGLIISMTYEYTYDDKGLLVKKSLTDTSGEGSLPMDSVDYFYDDSGKLVSEYRNMMQSSGEVYDIEITYTYDENERLISKTEIWDNINMGDYADRIETITTYNY